VKNRVTDKLAALLVEGKKGAIESKHVDAVYIEQFKRKKLLF